MWNAREICSHLSYHWLQALIDQFLQIIILPPRLSHVMIGENSSSVGDEKAGAENIQVYFRTISGEAHERMLSEADHTLDGRLVRIFFDKVMDAPPGSTARD